MIDAETAKALRGAAGKAEQWTAGRNALIVLAVGQGGSLREVAELAGVSHATVDRIVKDAKP